MLLRVSGIENGLMVPIPEPGSQGACVIFNSSVHDLGRPEGEGEGFSTEDAAWTKGPLGDGIGHVDGDGDLALSVPNHLPVDEGNGPRCGNAQEWSGIPWRGQQGAPFINAGRMTAGIGVAQWVVVNIRIPVQRLRVPGLGHDGIRLEEAAQGRVIEAGPV